MREDRPIPSTASSITGRLHRLAPSQIRLLWFTYAAILVGLAIYVAAVDADRRSALQAAMVDLEGHKEHLANTTSTYLVSKAHADSTQTLLLDMVVQRATTMTIAEERIRRADEAEHADSISVNLAQLAVKLGSERAGALRQLDGWILRRVALLFLALSAVIVFITWIWTARPEVPS